MLEFSKIPTAELEIFKKLVELDSIDVIFDVGARNDTELMDIHEAEYHLFEPNPEFFRDLELNVNGRKARLNCFGLGDRVEDRPYDHATQSFIMNVQTAPLPIKTLDGYVKEQGVEKIDFLKIDTEGYDHRVIVGGLGILPNVKYIQYEHWDDKEIFHKLLERDFDMEYTGYRNVLCINKKLVPKKIRNKIIKFIRDNNFGLLG